MMTQPEQHHGSLDDRIMQFLLKHPLVGFGLIVLALLSFVFLGWGPGLELDNAKLEVKGLQNPTPVAMAALGQSVNLTYATHPTQMPVPTAMAAQAVKPAPELPLIRLFFTGDINPGRCPAQLALILHDFTQPYKLIAEKLAAADVTIGSLDGTISDMAPPMPCMITYNLIGPSQTVDGLKYAGFDVVTLATNHALDCGDLGWRCGGKVLEDTENNLLSAGIQQTGSGANITAARAPVVVERQGVRFAFLGVNAISGDSTWATSADPGTAPLSDEQLAQVTAYIAAARKAADVVIVLPHWGVEYVSEPDSSQREWATAMIDAGATLVIGNHPHVVQPVEVFPDGGVVAYALGNFVFDQGPVNTNQGIVFEADFRGPELVNWQLLPIRINYQFQPDWASPNEAEEILNRIFQAGQEITGR